MGVLCTGRLNEKEKIQGRARSPAKCFLLFLCAEPALVDDSFQPPQPNQLIPSPRRGKLLRVSEKQVALATKEVGVLNSGAMMPEPE